MYKVLGIEAARQSIYNEFSENKNVKYLSHTINPEYDNTKTLKKYAESLKKIMGAVWELPAK